MADGVPMREAADRLGISVAAVRQRIRRGTLESFKGEDGRWYVRIPTVPDAVRYAVPSAVPPADDVTSALLDTLRSENAFLRGEVEIRNRELADRTREVQELHVLLQNAQRLIPATVPDAPHPPEQSGDRESPAAQEQTPLRGAQREPEVFPKQRWPWWMRILGGK